MKAATQSTYSKSEYDSISIHAAREGGDNFSPRCIGLVTRFQSTPPVKAATFTSENGLYSLIISIHAAREGGDYTTGVPERCI